MPSACKFECKTYGIFIHRYVSLCLSESLSPVVYPELLNVAWIECISML